MIKISLISLMLLGFFVSAQECDTVIIKPFSRILADTSNYKYDANYINTFRSQDSSIYSHQQFVFDTTHVTQVINHKYYEMHVLWMLRDFSIDALNNGERSMISDSKEKKLRLIRFDKEGNYERSILIVQDENNYSITNRSYFAHEKIIICNDLILRNIELDTMFNSSFDGIATTELEYHFSDTLSAEELDVYLDPYIEEESIVIIESFNSIKRNVLLRFERLPIEKPIDRLIQLVNHFAASTNWSDTFDDPFIEFPKNQLCDGDITGDWELVHHYAREFVHPLELGRKNKVTLKIYPDGTYEKMYFEYNPWDNAQSKLPEIDTRSEDWEIEKNRKITDSGSYSFDSDKCMLILSRGKESFE